MKKTYSAPELIKVELLTAPMMSVPSKPETLIDDEGEVGTQASKAFAGGLWEDDTEE